METPSYSKHLETLMAVVTHLAVHEWPIRQPKGIAKDLSIEVDEVSLVLKGFKGLFRESVGVSKDHGEPFYALHLRFARQIVDDDNNKKRPPLGSEYLIPLLEFISRRASEESQRGTTMTAALIISGLALAASLITIAVTIIRAH